MDKEWADLMKDNVTHLRSKVDKMDDKVDRIDKSLSIHKVKTGFWGAVGGMLVQLINIFR